jgi:PEP-CTERM motif-containing protein
LCNTGQPVGCVGTLPDANIDANYNIISGPLSGPTNTVIVDGFPIPPWVANDSDSKWIGPTLGSGSDADSNGPVGTYVYRTTFNLAGLDPATASITGLWSTDNPGLDILINGISTGQAIPSSTAFTALFPFSITSGFLPGPNTLAFVLSNEGGPTGLRVDSIAGTAQPIGGAPVPEPTTLLLFGSGLAGVAARRRLRRRAGRP